MSIGVKKDSIVAELTIAQKEVAEKYGVVQVNAEINRRLETVTVDKDGKLTSDFITSLILKSVTEDTIPDIPYNYVLQYQPSRMATDRICLGVQKSLLQFVEATNKDETGNIIISISKFAGRFSGLTPFAASVTKDELKHKLSMKIDPFDIRDIRSLNKAIAGAFPGLDNRFQFRIDGLKKFGTAHPPEACPRDKICYRTVVPVRVGLVDINAKSATMRYAQLINRAEIHTIDVTRAFMVEKISRLDFLDGVLTNARIDKPSEGLEVAKLPLTVYDAVMTSALAAPGQFLGKITPDTSPDVLMDILKDQKETLIQVSQIQNQSEAFRSDVEFKQLATYKENEQNKRFRISCNGVAPASNKLTLGQ